MSEEYRFLNKFNKVSIEQLSKIGNALSKRGHYRRQTEKQVTKDVKKHFCSNRFVDTWTRVREAL